MTQRRSLVQGLNNTPTVSEEEKAFVYEREDIAKPEPAKADPVATEPAAAPIPSNSRARVPLTTRCRPELAMAIKRASLERQISGETPASIQDIIEQALEQWLSRT